MRRISIATIGILLTLLLPALAPGLHIVHAAPAILTTSSDSNNPCGRGTTIGRSDQIAPGTLVVYLIIQNSSQIAPQPNTGTFSLGMNQWTQRGTLFKLTNGTYNWYLSEWYSTVAADAQAGDGWQFTLPVAQCMYAEFFEISGANSFDPTALPLEADNSGGSAVTSASISVDTSRANDLMLVTSLFLPKAPGLGNCPSQPTISSYFTLELSNCPQGGGAPGLLTIQDFTVNGLQNPVILSSTWSQSGNYLYVADAIVAAGGDRCQFNCQGSQSGAGGGRPAIPLNPLDPLLINWTALAYIFGVIWLFGLGFYARRRVTAGSLKIQSAPRRKKGDLTDQWIT